MTGDENTQPVGTVESLSDLVNMQDDGDTVADGAEVEETEDEEASEAESEEAPEGEEESEEGEEETTTTITVNGKDIEVTPEQLKDYAQMGADYTQKTQAVAEERKVVEAERSQVYELRTQQEQALEYAISQAQAVEQYLLGELGNAPDIDLAQYDPNQYIVQKAQYEQKAGKLNQVAQQIQQLQADHQRQRQGWINLQATECERVLKDTLPGWNDAKMTELHQFAVESGIGATDTSLLSPGYWQMLNDARAFRALQADKAKLKPAVKAVPKVIKQGTAHVNTRQEAMKKHRSAPSINSLSALMD